jgi:excisionase family DNA binding protein
MADGIPKLLPLAAVAEALAVSPHTVRMWIRKGKLRPVRLCRRLLFDPAEVTRFVAEAK